MQELTNEELNVFGYASSFGMTMPAWISAKDGKYFRPAKLDAAQSAEMASFLSLYNQHVQADVLARIGRWMTWIAILAIIGVVVSLITSI